MAAEGWRGLAGGKGGDRGREHGGSRGAGDKMIQPCSSFLMLLSCSGRAGCCREWLKGS